jgi:predicted MFS family arabinose efflux permease
VLVIAGLGMGSLSGCIAPVSVAQVDRDHAGAASGMLKTAQQIGGALGIASAGSVYFAWDGRLGAPPSNAAIGVIATLLAASVMLARRLPGDVFGSRMPSVTQ